MSKGAFFIRKQGDDEPRDATSPLEGYEYIVDMSCGIGRYWMAHDL